MGLYKYISNERVSVLHDGLYRFTQPSKFNDPFEFLPSIKGVMEKKELLQLASENPDEFLSGVESAFPWYLKFLPRVVMNLIALEMMNRNPETVDAALKGVNRKISPVISNYYQQKIGDKFGVFCLSENHNSILMWSHYANSHKGFVVEFDENHDFFNNKLSNGDNLEDLYKKRLSVKYRTHRAGTYIKNLSILDLLITKSSVWGYEEEVRYICPLEKAEQKYDDVFLFRIPSDSVRTVFLGAYISDADRLSIINSVKSHGGKISIYQAHLSIDRYEINYVRVPL